MQQIIEEIAEVVGIGAAYEIACRWGNGELYVPIKATLTHPISLTIGLEAARKLSAVFGGERLEIPIERNVLKDLRNEEIRKARVERGESLGKIARDFGLNRATIVMILRKAGVIETESREDVA
jgi:Mor family transcriptional regulator